MASESKLLAWTVPHRDGVVAAFVSADTAYREPATCVCADREQGWRWVETQAASLGVEVEWLNQPR
jgi:hypothetical protein